MANSYFANQNLNDITIQSKDGGGMTLTNQGKFLFGAKLPSVNQQLNEEFYQGTVDINANTNSSFVGVMNAQSEPIDLNISNTNQYSLFAPSENTIIQTKLPKDDCSNLFNDTSTVLLNWENDNRNLGWGPYGIKEAQKLGIGPTDLKKAQDYTLVNYWLSNNKNDGVGGFDKFGSLYKNDPKLIINNLPPGLRIMASQFNFNSGQWWTRIIVAVGEDFLNAKGSNNQPLGIPYRKSTNIVNDPFSRVSDKNTGTTSANSPIIYNPTKNPPPGVETILWFDGRIKMFAD